ncbi:UNVERIFIED_CONTAM: hypothetical protein K2H54_033325 [Gekko kuhli]
MSNPGPPVLAPCRGVAVIAAERKLLRGRPAPPHAMAPAGGAAHALLMGVGQQVSKADPRGRWLGPWWGWGPSGTGLSLSGGRAVKALLPQPPPDGAMGKAGLGGQNPEAHETEDSEGRKEPEQDERTPEPAIPNTVPVPVLTPVPAYDPSPSPTAGTTPATSPDSSEGSSDSTRGSCSLSTEPHHLTHKRRHPEYLKDYVY